MNKKEKEILLNEYGYQYSLVNSGYSKDILFYKSLLDKLGLHNDRIRIENEYYMYNKIDLKCIQIDAYNNIINLLAKYNNNKLIKVEELSIYIDEIKYQLTNSEKKYMNEQLEVINSYIRV